MELFPPLFTAFAGKHSKVLKAIRRGPPLPPAGGPDDWQPYHDIVQAALDGLDALLAQETRPGRWEL